MSKVMITTDLGPITASVMSYVANAFAELGDYRIRIAGISPPDYSANTLAEEVDLLLKWMGTIDITDVPTQFHRIPKSFKKDWPNPAQWALDTFGNGGLPQEPQTRRRINDGDIHRTIRLKQR